MSRLTRRTGGTALAAEARRRRPRRVAAPASPLRGGDPLRGGIPLAAGHAGREQLLNLGWEPR